MTQACPIRALQPSDHSNWLRDKHISQLETMRSNLCTSVKEACSPFLWIGGYQLRATGSQIVLQEKSLNKGKVNSEEGRAEKKSRP